MSIGTEVQYCSSHSTPRMIRTYVRYCLDATGTEQTAQRTVRRLVYAISIKRCLDVVLTIVGLLFLAPLLLAIAIIIRVESKGPVIFRQTRTGLHGNQFQIYKFRTMIVQENGNNVRQASRNDDRFTRIGHFLRRISADELPQLLNVLKGDMSLVGPRPHALVHDSYYSQKIRSYNKRFAVRPGITGWAQIHGARGPTLTVEDMRRRVMLDLWYIQNASLAIDLRILTITLIIEVFRSRSAF